jgi:hypothetical protein
LVLNVCECGEDSYGNCCPCSLGLSNQGLIKPIEPELCMLY